MYLRPATLQHAFEALGAARPPSVLAGGTDHFPARVGRPPAPALLDLTAIDELRGIRPEADGWRIGATTTWSALLEADLPPLFDGLKRAAREVGGMQIQNAGTVGGNLCNASPAADGVPPLLALDASVELASAGARRVLKLHEFILGPRKTALGAGELLVAIHVPRPRHEARSHFLKLGARRYLLISIAMVGATVEIDCGVVQSARVAVGACSPVAQRLHALEKRLEGREARRLGDHALPEHLSDLRPLDDVRASAAYRLDAALTLVRRTLDAL